MHKIINLELNQFKILINFELNWSSKLGDNSERKTPLSGEVVCFQMLDFDFWDLKIQFWALKNKFVKNYFFLENYVSSEGAISHDYLYYQQLPVMGLVTK